MNADRLLRDSVTETPQCPDNRVILVNQAGRIVWQYGKTGVSGAGFDQLNNPNSAELLANGHILIADENNKQIVFAQGMIQVDGNGFDQLNAPYDAKVIGDYTGLTPPFGFGR